MKTASTARRKKKGNRDANPARLEKRLVALEKEVAMLRAKLNGLAAPKKNWIEEMSGSMKDNPAFPEAMRLSAELLRADQPSRAK